MRKIIVLSMLTLDGIIQGPGSPEEDPSGNFEFGGWVAPYDDEVTGKVMERLLKPSDLLLGRKTFEIWENYWPAHGDYWPGINEVTKYVFSKTRKKSDWNNSVFLESLDELEKIRQSDGSDIQVWGSGELVQHLLREDLVDELWLMLHPLTLGKGKKLFTDGAIPAAFSLLETNVTPSGVINAHYRRAGKVLTGTVGAG